MCYQLQDSNSGVKISQEITVKYRKKCYPDDAYSRETDFRILNVFLENYNFTEKLSICSIFNV